MRSRFWCAAALGAQRDLVAAAPDRPFVPPYVGTRGWLGVLLAGVSSDAVTLLGEKAYRCVASARRVDLLAPH